MNGITIDPVTRVCSSRAVAAKTIVAINIDGIEFLCDLGRRISHKAPDDHRESAFLFQRLSVLIQRYNAIAVLGTHTTCEDKCSRSLICSSF